MIGSKDWYVHWHSKLVTSKGVSTFWKFFGINIVYLYIVAAVALMFVPHMRPGIFVLAAVAVVTKVVVVKALALIFSRRRPYQRYGYSPVGSGIFSRIDKDPDSFPSGHTASLSSAWVVLYLLSPTIAWIAVPLFMLTLIGRVILGYHYVTDILGGLIVGYIMGLFGIYSVHILTLYV